MQRFITAPGVENISDEHGSFPKTGITYCTCKWEMQIHLLLFLVQLTVKQELIPFPRLTMIPTATDAEMWELFYESYLLYWNLY